MKKLRTLKALPAWLDSLPEHPDPEVMEARAAWRLFLERKPESKAEWQRLSHLAGNWQLCACGVALPDELCDDTLADVSGQRRFPEDDELARLGITFSLAVCSHNYPKARRIFLAIQRREAEVLREAGL